MTNDEYIRILRGSRKAFVIIFVIHAVLFIVSLLLLYLENTKRINLVPDNLYLIANAAMFGFLGSLVYFIRKIYGYLISNKATRIIGESDLVEINTDVVRNSMIGYYLYVGFRPFLGLIIGPLLFMIVASGLVTFTNISISVDKGLTQSGRYFTYFLSFVGGHESSDVLDYISKLTKKTLFKALEDASDA